MQGLSPEHPDNSQPLQTSTPEGSPHQSEAPVITPPHVDTSNVAVVTTPSVELTESLEDFRITTTIEDYHSRHGERLIV
jgi:hypothetical protein